MTEDLKTNKVIYSVYTDGAYSSSRKQGGAGIVCLKGDELIFKKGFPYKNTTNNRMEIKAVTLALYCVRGHIDKLIIYTDSMYVIGCATQGWKREKNKDYWEIFDSAYAKALTMCDEIEFVHVKGHNGDKYNEIADKLAVEASQLEI